MRERPSGASGTVPNVLIARLICSDGDCDAVFEARAQTLGELEALACDCGCALEIIGWPDADEQPDGTLEVAVVG